MSSIIWIVIHVTEALMYVTALLMMSAAKVWRELSSKRELQIATILSCLVAIFILIFIAVHRV